MSLVSLLSSHRVIFKTELKSQISLGLLIANPFIFILRESVWILCRKHWVWIFFIHNVSGSCPETYFILQILWHFTSGMIIQIGFRLLNENPFYYTQYNDLQLISIVIILVSIKPCIICLVMLTSCVQKVLIMVKSDLWNCSKICEGEA